MCNAHWHSIYILQMSGIIGCRRASSKVILSKRRTGGSWIPSQYVLVAIDSSYKILANAQPNAVIGKGLRVFSYIIYVASSCAEHVSKFKVAR